MDSQAIPSRRLILWRQSRDTPVLQFRVAFTVRGGTGVCDPMVVTIRDVGMAVKEIKRLMRDTAGSVLIVYTAPDGVVPDILCQLDALDALNTVVIATSPSPSWELFAALNRKQSPLVAGSPDAAVSAALRILSWRSPELRAKLRASGNPP